MDNKKLIYIQKHINILDHEKKEHVCKILLTYNVNLQQTNNGVYCHCDELNDNIINTVYSYISKLLEK